MARNLADLIPAVFTGPNGQPLTEDQIRSRQLIARSLLQNATDTSPNAGGWASVLAKGVQGFAAGYQNRSADRGAAAATKADSDLSAALLGSLGGGSTPTVPMTSAAGQVSSASPVASQDTGILPQSLLSLLDKTEGAGGYDTLYGNAQKNQFAGTNVSQLPISDVLAFTDPSGAYAQSVKGQIGRVATPVGRYQIVGTTLRNAINELGIDPSTTFDAATQDKLALHLAKNRLASANTLEGKIAALRGEWHGLRNVPDNQLAQVVNDLESGRQVASAQPQTATDAINSVSPPSGYVDPVVTTAYAPPIPVSSAPLAPIGQGQTVADPTVAAPQNISPVAQALTAPVKGDRLGATTMQNFNERFGSPAPGSDVPEIYSQPQDFPAPQQTTVQATPQPAPVAAVPSLPAIQPPPALPPAVIQALSSPYASESTKRVAYSLLQQNQEQKQAYQEQVLKRQATQQALQQRQSVAQSLGINPQLAADDEAWKQAVAAASGGGSLINAGDGNLYDPRSKQWITAPNAGNKYRPATPEELKQYGAVAGQVGPDGKFYRQDPPRGTSVTYDPVNGFSFNEGSGVTQRPLTEGQSKDTFFNTRMETALPTLEANEDALLSLGGKISDAVPLNLGNYAQSEDYQLARDAGRDFVTAYLRKDSGAALTPSEEKMYGELLLPQPGDKQATIEAKRTRRRVAVEAIKAGMPQQALDNAVRAIKASGGDKAITPKKIDGYSIEELPE